MIVKIKIKRYHLFYLVPAILTILIALFIVYELRSSYNYEIQSAIIRNSGFAGVIASRLSASLREIDFIMQDVKDHVTFEQLSSNGDETKSETIMLNQLLSRKIKTHPWLCGLGVMNRNGIFVGSVNRERPQDLGADFSYREYFSFLATHTDQDLYYSPAFRETETGDIWMASSRTLRLKEKQFDGVIFAGLSGKFLLEELGNINFAEGGSIALLDVSKQLLFRNPPITEMLGKKVNDPNIDNFFSNNENSLTYIGLSPLDKQEKIITLQRVQGTPYVFAVASNMKSTLAGWYVKRNVYIAGWLFSAIILFLITHAHRQICITKNILEEKNKELQKALDEIKTLQGIIPICAQCKKIRDEKGYWDRVESYISKHTQALFSHGLCPDCYDHAMREFENTITKPKQSPDSYIDSAKSND